MLSTKTARASRYMVLVIFLAFWGVPGAQGQLVPVPNPSFEQGDTSPEGWRLPQGEGAWIDEGAHGQRAIAVTGDGTDQSANFWLSREVPLEADTTYRLRFQARHIEGLGRSLFTGFNFHNRDLPELTQEWQRFTTYFITPPELRRGQTQMRFVQWDINGTAAFDDIEVVKTEAVYRRMGDIQLGEGERIQNGRYLFNAPFSGESTNHARPLEGFTCYFNKPRWVFGPGDWVRYRHQVGSLTQTGGNIEIVTGHYSGGELDVEASIDGETWQSVGLIARRDTTRAVLPESLFPAREVWIRLRMRTSAEPMQDIISGGSIQVYGYHYHADLEDAPGDFYGATRFVAVEEASPSVQVAYDDFGAAIPGENTLRLYLTNRSGGNLEIAPVIQVSTASGQRVETASAPILLFAGEAPVELAIPYEIPGVGDVSIDIDLGGNSGYRAETNFNISPLYEASYGALLPAGSDEVALWGASSGWKVSRVRPAPRERDTALRIQAARNESEAAQVVLRPSIPLDGLRVTPQALVNAEGGALPAEAIQILLVGYVPVEQPSDDLGAVAPWPDPLPPIDGPIDLKPNENQPLWVQVDVPRDAQAGIYHGAIMLEATGWQAEVPLEIEVFDFTLPDRKTCQSAFGFDGNLAATYHGVSSEEDRRTLAALYAEMFSAHHISPYELGQKLIYPDLEYAWPNLPKWGGDGVRVTGDEFPGGGALHIHDADTARTVKAIYEQRFDIPEEGLKIAFRHKSATPDHPFIYVLLHYDASGAWMPGQNTMVTLQGGIEWQDYVNTVNRFPEGARQFAIEWQPALYAEDGSTTGTVWLNTIRVSDAGSGSALIEDDFAPYQSADFERMFQPEFNWEAWDAEMKRILDSYHFNSFVLRTPGLGFGAGWAQHDDIPGTLLGYPEDTPEYNAAFNAWYSEAENHLRDKGWLKKAFIYWFDEPEPRQYDFVMAGNLRMKAAAPDLQRMLTEEVVPELIGGPNLWCPISYEFDIEAAEARRAEGDRFWWYICTGPKAPYATLFIDHPGTELRVWLWQTWERRIEGILIWQTNYWTSDAAYPDGFQNPYEDPMGWCHILGDLVPSGARHAWGNGDGRFLYPPLKAAGGNPGAPVLEAPVASIRINMLRDGIEDYEYLVMLDELIEQHKDTIPADELAQYRELLDVPPSISESMTEFTWDPAPIEARREAVARAIVRLKTE